MLILDPKCLCVHPSLPCASHKQSEDLGKQSQVMRTILDNAGSLSNTAHQRSSTSPFTSAGALVVCSICMTAHPQDLFQSKARLSRSQILVAVLRMVHSKDQCLQVVCIKLHQVWLPLPTHACNSITAGLALSDTPKLLHTTPSIHTFYLHKPLASSCHVILTGVHFTSFQALWIGRKP